MGPVIPLLLLLLAVAFLLHADFFVTVLWFLLGIYVLSRVWVQRSAQNLRVSRRFEDRAFTGDEVTVDVALRNRGRLPISWLEVTESVPLDLRAAAPPAEVINLSGRGEHHLRYELHCKQRGYYRLGPMRLQTGDLLGLDQRVLYAEETRPFIVYPRIVPLQRLGLPTLSALVSVPARTPLFEDPSRIMGVRAYQPGDSPRRVHWSASAHAGQLLVKQYQPAIARDTLLCLDLDVRDYELFQWYQAVETAIVVAASLAHHSIVRDGLPVGLATEGEDPLLGGRRRIVIPPGDDRQQLMSILEILARIKGTARAGFVDLVRLETVRLQWGSTVVVIAGQIGRELAETLLHLKRGGHAVALILIQPVHLRGRVEGAEALGIPVHHVWTDRDLAAL